MKKQEYDFCLILSGIEELTDEVQDGLYEAGCDDATLSMRCGQCYLTFAREADSLKAAILSAIRDVRLAGIGADVLRVDSCSLVTLAEIARRIGRTRQMVHQYSIGTRGPGGFPPPASHIGERPFWHWSEVAHWLWKNGLIKEDAVNEAVVVSIVNDQLEIQGHKRRNPELSTEIMEDLGSEFAVTA